MVWNESIQWGIQRGSQVFQVYRGLNRCDYANKIIHQRHPDQESIPLLQKPVKGVLEPSRDQEVKIGIKSTRFTNISLFNDHASAT